MLVANGIAYGATVNIAYPEDMIERVRTAKTVRGPKFLHVFSPCPSGWKMDPSKTIEVASLATRTGMFPLYEYRDGQYRFTKEIKNRKPVEEYLRLQRRFRHLSPEQVAEVQYLVDQELEELRGRVEAIRK